MPWTGDRGLSEDRQREYLGVASVDSSSSEPIVGLTLGSVDAETISSQTQEVVGVIDELAADVLAFCGQAVTVLS